jgi:hypothetical protein
MLIGREIAVVAQVVDQKIGGSPGGGKYCAISVAAYADKSHPGPCRY